MTEAQFRDNFERVRLVEVPRGMFSAKTGKLLPSKTLEWEEFCWEHDMDPLYAGRRAWISHLRTYLRGACCLIYTEYGFSGLAYSGGYDHEHGDHKNHQYFDERDEAE